MEAIKTQGLTKYYGRSRGIVDLDLSVGQGEFFGFIGPNGAGKSTTIRTLLGLIKCSSGSVSIFGRDIVKDKMEILSNVGYLPSEVMFYQKMKVKDVIKMSADMRKKNCRAEAEILCERLQLDTEKKVEELSFGNRKKAAIVCAMQHCPKLYILDEPTSGLDPLMQREFFNILRERNAQGATIFLSSHILSEIQANCTRAAIIREGRIIACDSVENLSKTSARRVVVQGDIETERLEGIKGMQQNVTAKRPDTVKDLYKNGRQTSFLYSGDMNRLLKVLAEGNITDLTISEPTLEEIFMHYYEEGGEA